MAKCNNDIEWKFTWKFVNVENVHLRNVSRMHLACNSIVVLQLLVAFWQSLRLARKSYDPANIQ